MNKLTGLTQGQHLLHKTFGPVRLDIVTVWLLAMAVLALIGTVYLAQASQAAREGVQLELLKQELSVLQRENTQLEVEIANAQDPERLAERAAELGYRPALPEELDYVPVRNYPYPTPTPAAVEIVAPDPLAAWWAAVWGDGQGGP